MSRRRQMRFALAVVSLGTLGLMALAPSVLADEPPPTPLPEAISGPSADAIRTSAEHYGLTCDTVVAPNGEEYVCYAEAGTEVYYTLAFPAEDPLWLQAFISGPLPWPETHDQFLFDIVSQFCEPQSADAIVVFIGLAREAGTTGLTHDDRACSLYSDFATDRIPTQAVIAWARVDPTALPTLPPTLIPTAPPPLATPTASPTPAATAPAPGPTPPADGGSVIRPGGFVRAVPAPDEIASEPLVIAESLALAGLLVLLMPFPAQLFNSTLETHYKTVRRWFRLDALQTAAGRFGGIWDSLVGILLFVLLSAAIYALLDPSVGLDVSGAATITGLAIGMVVVTVMASLPSLVDALRTRTAWRPRALPATLVIGLICVLISRLTGFLPGYLYGVILGFVFARELSRAEQGRANGLAAVAMLVMALVAWLGLTLIGSDTSGVVATIAATTFATLLVAGLEAVVFGLLPFKFLPGEPLHATNRLFWAALLFIGAFAFFHILINPASGYLSSTSRTPLFTIVGLFLAFGLLSIAFWAYFRNKPVEA